MCINHIVKEKRQKMGLSQTLAAELASISQPTLSQIEKGWMPTVETAKRLG